MAEFMRKGSAAEVCNFVWLRGHAVLREVFEQGYFRWRCDSAPENWRSVNRLPRN